MEEPQPVQQPVLKPKKKMSGQAVAVSAVVIILLAVIGYLAWQLKISMDQSAAYTADKKQLQSKVDDLAKQLADAKVSKSTSTGSDVTPTPCQTQTTISQSLKDNIAAAVSSKNTAALESYMASSVNVAVAASGKTGAETPAQAVTDLDYLSSGTAPWNFNLPAATLSSFKAGAYKKYFEGTVYVGESANKYVVSFGFDTCGKINQVFMAVNVDLLM